jgi:hypothetical protein
MGAPPASPFQRAQASHAPASRLAQLPCYDLVDEMDFWACTPPVWRTAAFVGLALCDALAVALFYTSMLVAPKYITGGEVALVMLLEDLLGPLWVYVRFGEVPSAWTLAAGALLVSTLATHECLGSGKGRPMPTLEAFEGYAEFGSVDAPPEAQDDEAWPAAEHVYYRMQEK